jgi:medium-chain acyl-[acyl-carrier-protein] hydrolase
MKSKLDWGPWLIQVSSTTQAVMRLFCFPYAGAGGQVFFPWRNAFPSMVETWAVQYPGRGARSREGSLTSMEALTVHATQAIQSHLDKPFALFGHSMGALLAFEVAKRLRALAKPQPLHLFLSGTGAPHLPQLGEPLHALPMREFTARLREFDGTPSEVFETPELLDLLVPVLRADFQVCETYTCARGQPLEIPLTIYGGLEDKEAPQSYLDAWAAHSTRSLKTYSFPGGHFFLRSHSGSFLKVFRADIEKLVGTVAACASRGLSSQL